jgi:hypothetical protein
MMKLDGKKVWICESCSVAFSEELCPKCNDDTLFDLATGELRCTCCAWTSKTLVSRANMPTVIGKQVPKHKAPKLSGNENNDSIKRYSGYSTQPIEYIMANGLGFAEGNVIKYITRWRDKNGIEDLKKAKQYVEFLINNAEKGNPLKNG